MRTRSYAALVLAVLMSLVAGCGGTEGLKLAWPAYTPSTMTDQNQAVWVAQTAADQAGIGDVSWRKPTSRVPAVRAAIDHGWASRKEARRAGRPTETDEWTDSNGVHWTETYTYDDDSESLVQIGTTDTTHIEIRASVELSGTVLKMRSSAEGTYPTSEGVLEVYETLREDISVSGSTAHLTGRMVGQLRHKTADGTILEQLNYGTELDGTGTESGSGVDVTGTMRTNNAYGERVGDGLFWTRSTGSFNFAGTIYDDGDIEDLDVWGTLEFEASNGMHGTMTVQRNGSVSGTIYDGDDNEIGTLSGTIYSVTLTFTDSTSVTAKPKNRVF